MGRPAITYTRPRWSTGQRAAVAGALLAAAFMPIWLVSLGSGSRPTEPSPPIVKFQSAPTPAMDPVSQVQQQAPLPFVAPMSFKVAPAPAKPEAPAAPYRYSGHWRQGSHISLVLTSPGHSVVVRVPGPVDDRFDVESIDEKRVLLRDHQLQKMVALPLSGESAQFTVEPVKVEQPAIDTTAAMPSAAPSEKAAPPSTPAVVPLVQFGGGGGDSEPEN